MIPAFEWDGIAVGEHAAAGALRYYARGDLENEPLGEAVLRRYLEAALLSTFAVRQLLLSECYDVAVFHHGIYVPQGLVGEVCRSLGVRVVNSNPAYRNRTFIFSHGDSYHHTMISEPASAWQSVPWSAELERRTLTYLKSRWEGTQDWIVFHDSPQMNPEEIARHLGVSRDRPCIGMLTNVMWDAQLHYRSNAFPDMLSWVRYTLEHFAGRPDLQLIIRVHPAEVSGAIPSRQRILDEIRKSHPELPGNIVVIPPESRISTYAAMQLCSTVLIYNTKTGIELSAMGIPVVVAGEAWIRNKGFSVDVSSKQEYQRVLERLPTERRLPPEQLEMARRYAFHFFFRRMVPLPFITSPEPFRFELALNGLSELRPGRYPGLDIICNGILTGTPFVYPAEDERYDGV
jgi:hypothetical protein